MRVNAVIIVIMLYWSFVFVGKHMLFCFINLTIYAMVFL